MSIQNEIAFIKKHFLTCFEDNNFVYKESNSHEIIFKNHCSELIFRYNIRYSLIFEDLYYVNLVNNKKYLISYIFRKVIPEISFTDLVKSHTGEYGNLKMTTLQAYSIIVPQYLGSIIKSSDFSWKTKFNLREDQNNLLLEFNNYDSYDSFDFIIKKLNSSFSIKITEKLNGPESRVCKFKLEDKELSLHNNPYGNYIKASQEDSKEKLKNIVFILDSIFY